MTQEEAAEELGVSRVTVNKRAQRVRAQLRLTLTPDSQPLMEVRA
jgi:DNA-directed RNA polymerase specialized sigma24 family protein